MHTHDEIVWSAGFFDGEGSICLSKRAKTKPSGNPAYILAVNVAQKDDELLAWFQEKWGGYLSKMPQYQYRN